MDDLKTLAHIACEEAIRAGADFADVSISRGRSTRLNVEKNGIHDMRERRSAGVSVRAIVNGGRAFASTSRIDEAFIRETAQRAAAAAKIAEPDPDFVSLPGPAEYAAIEGLRDDRVAAIDPPTLIAALMTEVDGARAVDSRAVVEGGASASESEHAIVNSLGVEGVSASTRVSLHVSCVIRVGDDVGSYYDFTGGRVLDDFTPGGLGARVCEQTKRFLNQRTCKTAVLPIIAGPLAASSFIGALAGAANAEHIQRGRSYFIGKRGEKIGPDFLTIVDDPFIPRGMGSGPFDDEGAPAQRVAIIENGVLANWLHGSYTANKAGEPNNGHGTRSGGVSTSNINPALGERTAAELIAETKEGIYIDRGDLAPSMASGELSATVDFGFKIENGELVYPVKNTMIGIGVWDMLNNLEAISSDYRAEPGAIMPTLRIAGVRVAGGE